MRASFDKCKENLGFIPGKDDLLRVSAATVCVFKVSGIHTPR
jgi:hypothetical protein